MVYNYVTKGAIMKQKKIDARDLKVGDVMWFSGFWQTITAIKDNKIYGIINPDAPRGPNYPDGVRLCCVEYPGSKNPRCLCTIQVAE